MTKGTQKAPAGKVEVLVRPYAKNLGAKGEVQFVHKSQRWLKFEAEILRDKILVTPISSSDEALVSAAPN